MPDIAKVLKEEINRLARRQSRALNRSLVKQVRDLRQATARQKEQIARLERIVATLQKAADIQPAEAPAEEEARTVRMGPANIKRLRSRLKLSQRELGQLLGVSANTVLRWEAGQIAPRRTSKAAFAKLKGIGIREAKERLESA